MPSLKDLRNRIASVKATQKITKAMQMVAAAKLRRAQTAAEAARPLRRAHEPGARQPRRPASRRPGVAAPPRRHRLRPDASPRRLHGRARPVRRLQLVDRAARARPRQPRSSAEGKTVKIICVGKKGYDILRRQFERPDHRLRRPARRPQLGFEHADADRPEDPGALRGGRVRRRDAVLLAVQVGDLADPDGAADHPGARSSRTAAAAPPTRSTNTSPTRARSSPTCCRATSPSRSSGRCSRTPPPSRARA